jgi:hypothetical protein
VQIKGGSADIEIRACQFADGGERAVNAGGSTGFQFFRPPLSTDEPNAEARRVLIISSVFEGWRAPIAYVGCVDCVVRNNTIISPRRWVMRILQETTSSGGFEFEACRDGVFENNLVYFEDAMLSRTVNVGSGTEPGTFSFRTNLWYAFDNPAASAPDLPTPETGGVVGLDPGLGDPASGDYRPAPAGVAAGAGTAPGPEGGDFFGACWGDPPAIGAIETDLCFADLAPPTGVLDLSDLNAFAMSFLAGDLGVDFDGNGVLDLGDVGSFVQGFVVGCP